MSTVNAKDIINIILDRHEKNISEKNSVEKVLIDNYDSINELKHDNEMLKGNIKNLQRIYNNALDKVSIDNEYPEPESKTEKDELVGYLRLAGEIRDILLRD